MDCFEDIYAVEKNRLVGTRRGVAGEWMQISSGSIFRPTEHSLTPGDAFVLQTAAGSDAGTPITWDPRIFARRASLPVFLAIGLLPQQGIAP